MKPTLLILAAGMASRYGSMKQVDGFGPNGETIIDYSIYDAINAGFGKISFIIREEFADQFSRRLDSSHGVVVSNDHRRTRNDVSNFLQCQNKRSRNGWSTSSRRERCYK